jgi:putative flippase GtrA
MLNKLIDLTQKIPLLKLLPVSFYRFLVVGVIGFIIDFTLFNLFFYLFNIRQTITVASLTEEIDIIFSVANVMAVILSAVIGYALNKIWSFGDKSDNVASQLSKYIGVTVFNMSLNNVFFGLLFYELFQQDAIVTIAITSSVSKILSTGFQAISSYLAYKYIVFREDKEVISEATVP